MKKPFRPAWTAGLGEQAIKNGFTFVVTDRDDPDSWLKGRKRWLVVNQNQARFSDEAKAWERGYIAGKSITMRRMSDEPRANEAENPFLKGGAILDPTDFLMEALAEEVAADYNPYKGPGSTSA